MNNKKKISESRVIIENGEIKTIFSEEIENNGGWMDIDEAFDLIIDALNLQEQQMNNENQNKKTSF